MRCPARFGRDTPEACEQEVVGTTQDGTHQQAQKTAGSEGFVQSLGSPRSHVCTLQVFCTPRTMSLLHKVTSWRRRFMGKRSIPAATVFICSALLVATGWIPLASPVSASRPAAGPATAQSAKALG